MRGVWYRGVIYRRYPDGSLEPVGGHARLDALVDDCIKRCLADDNPPSTTENTDNERDPGGSPHA